MCPCMNCSNTFIKVSLNAIYTFFTNILSQGKNHILSVLILFICQNLRTLNLKNCVCVCVCVLLEFSEYKNLPIFIRVQNVIMWMIFFLMSC
jgi:hypothetical protein